MFAVVLARPGQRFSQGMLFFSHRQAACGQVGTKQPPVEFFA